MAVKKLISSPSASSSSSSDSSFERFVAQRTPSLKCKQHDSEGEEKESEDSSSEDDNDSSSDEERFVAQPAPSLKCKQQHSKEGEEKESKEDEEKTKSPATKSVSHPSQAHQSCTEQDKIKEFVPHPSQQSSEEEEEEEEEEDDDDDDKAKSPATKSVSHPSQAHQSCTEQDKIKESVPHPSQQSSDQEEEEEDAKSLVENSESLVQSEKKLKPNFVPAKKQISSPSASSSSDDANDSSSDKEQFVAQPVPSLKRKQRNSKEREEKESEGDSDEEEDEEKAKSPVRKCVSHLSQVQQSCTEEEKQKENTKESVPHPSQQSSSSEEEEKEEEDAKLPVENSESFVQPQKKRLKPNSVPAGKSPSTATNSAVQRIWSVEDELVLLHALSHHHNTYGKVPSSKEYGSFLTTIIGSLTFLATEKQLGNKIRTWKTNYAQRKKMGSKPKPLNPHEIEVFKICAKLFEDVRNTKSVGGVAKGNSTIYLREVISRQKLPTWLSTVEDMVQQLGESRARDLEAKAKQLSIDEMKLNAREVKLMADLFDFIADGMAGDG